MRSSFTLLSAAGLLLLVGQGAWAASASSLQVDYANGGVTSPDLATCVKGSFYSGSDTRFCDGSQHQTAAVAGDTLSGWGWATFANGISSQAWGVAAFGTLKAYAQSAVPAGVTQSRNTQSRGAVTMYDVLTASNGNGAATTTYHFTVTVNGSLSAPQGSFTGIYPLSTGNVFASFSVSPVCFACGNVVANWSSGSGQAASTVYAGTFTVPTGVQMQLSAGLDTSSYINTQPFQTAFAEASYGNTMHLHIDAVTPGANTVGASGFNYASAVPEPSSALLLLAGVAGLAGLAGRAQDRARGRSSPQIKPVCAR